MSEPAFPLAGGNLMSKDGDVHSRQQREGQGWLSMASYLAPLLSLALKVLELAPKFLK